MFVGEYKLYNGEVILKFYGFPKHLYTVNEKPVDGVTNVTNIVDKSRPLMNWAVKKSLKYIEGSLCPGKALDEVEISTLLGEAERQPYTSKSNAANLGTMIHNWIEKYIKGQKPDKPINASMLNAINAFLHWQKENKIKFIDSEKKIYSRKYNYAGTLDAEADINGKKSVIDFKTSKGIYSEMRYQVAAYQAAREEETGEKYGERYIVRFGKTLNSKGEVDLEVAKLDEYERDLDGFLGALKLYRREKELKYRKVGQKQMVLTT